MQTEGCSCGCDMKIAECRIKDPACGVSKKLAGSVVKETDEGKDAAFIRADLSGSRKSRRLCWKTRLRSRLRAIRCGDRTMRS